MPHELVMSHSLLSSIPTNPAEQDGGLTKTKIPLLLMTQREFPPTPRMQLMSVQVLGSGLQSYSHHLLPTLTTFPTVVKYTPK